ncbi:HesA/MoeB/ThiF family protein [Vibrio sp. SM6]|uniref:HesA/MoeB/ThiF family protein n=1 Tax=Vibrio agarilyticus TaxID=2726741 RepID=A0A7X8YI47_9VIBR|nr:HesA/MoeB/ThiF family protein [Vibrio agarilyticus]NLS14798.1 HesA/MoeB/ThiF family protein [Vibrio agarilyticus]
MLSDKQFFRYQRQIALPEIGEQGQAALSHSHVLMIGCGGLGSAASLYLAAAGVGKLVVVDDDVVDSSNLQRQVIYREADLGQSKSDTTKAQLLALNPMVNVRALSQRLEHSQLQLEVMLADLVLDCTDNLATRHQISQVCFAHKTPLVSAAAIGWQGQFAVFDYSQDDQKKGCYRCLVPFDELPTKQRCSDSGVVGPVVGTLGNYQALAAIQKLATGRFGIETGQLHLFDGLRMQWQTLSISKDEQCPVCANYLD